MLIKRNPSWAIPEQDVTPESLYLNRRQIMAGAAGVAAMSAMPGAAHAATSDLSYSAGNYGSGETLTPYEAVTQYNNYYEFGTGKEDPAENAHTLITEPWSITVEGEAEKTGTFALEDVIKDIDLEERIYRLRCVEAWSMVIPWVGVPLSKVIERFKPTSNAKYVQFFTLADKDQMPGLRSRVLRWPYREGLRIDEAMNPLTLLAVGLYGKTLPNQNGAPIRLVVPWKYGFKSIKSIVRIRFTETEPETSWKLSNAREYGFYSNVNPNVDHPRWSQRKERRIGDFLKRSTLMFNGYGDEVAGLYEGMDLRTNY